MRTSSIDRHRSKATASNTSAGYTQGSFTEASYTQGSYRPADRSPLRADAVESHESPATPLQITTLDPSRNCPEAIRLEMEMKRRVVGHDAAIAQIVAHYQTWLAGLAAPGRPVCNLLLLGPTGCGKTRIVEAIAESLVGDAQAVVKVDCGEFQHSHEIAKLIGSPPGYLGHRETHPRLCQEKLDLYHTESVKLSFVLFDEVEKASDALWNLLLGILDKGTLTLGDNRTVDFSNTMVFLTGNLGTAEAQRLRELPWGFSASPDGGIHTLGERLRAKGANTGPINQKGTHAAAEAADTGDTQPRVSSDGILSADGRQGQTSNELSGTTGPHGDLGGKSMARPHDSRQHVDMKNVDMQNVTGQDLPTGRPLRVNDRLDQRMEKSVMQAARRKFSPEFLNRLDRVVFCRALDEQQVAAVLDLELQNLLVRIRRQRNCTLGVSLSEEARDFLIAEGFDPDCGARYLKRAMDKHLVQALSSLLATHQLEDGDELLVDMEDSAGMYAGPGRLCFRRGDRRSKSQNIQQLAARWRA
jgi:ATP-dependent Clp protease ATP-binding subunit ClpA